MVAEHMTEKKVYILQQKNGEVYMEFYPSYLTTMFEEIEARVLQKFVEVTYQNKRIPKDYFFNVPTIPWGSTNLSKLFTNGVKQIMLPEDARLVWKSLVEMGWKLR